MTKSWNTLLDNKVLGADNFYAVRVFKLRHKTFFGVLSMEAELARRGSGGSQLTLSSQLTRSLKI